MTDNNVQNLEKLSFGKTLVYAAGTIPASYAPALIVGWLMYFYNPGEEKGAIYLGLGAFVMVQFIGRLMDSVSDPLVGYFSDKTKSRFGRRIPYIVLGTPVLAVTMALIWFPLTDGPSFLNGLWLLVNLLLFWLAYTVVVAPYLSLLPEIAPEDKNRNFVGGFLGFGEVLGTLMGAAIFPILINTFKDGLTIGPIVLSDGFKVVGIIAGIGILVFFALTIIFIKEKPYADSKDVPLNFYQAVRATLKNPAYPNFLIMIALLRLLVDVVFVLLPYYVTYRLHLDEEFAGFLSGAIILGAVVFFPFIILGSNKYGKKIVFSLGLLSFAMFLPLAIVVPFIPVNSDSAMKVTSLVVFALLAPGAAAFLVLQRVMITDIMDFDAKITGYRREAIYNGIEGMMTKFAAGLSPMIVAINLLLFGYEDGILAAFAVDALIALAAFIIFIPYPIRK